MSLFTVRETYSKKDIYAILNVPKEKQGGAWNTGYTRYNKDYYIFANIGVAGRTGHDYPNEIINNNLNWYGKNKSHINQDTIKNMISGKFNVHIFYRYDSREKFTYMGNGVAKEIKDTVPVNILWTFNKIIEGNLYEEKSDNRESEVEEETELYEGAYTTIKVNAYERNKVAREKCIEHYGAKCNICRFDFKKHYGSIGDGFIHVHHIIPLHKIDKEYKVDPIKDLIPVCPNCHAMLHVGESGVTVKELKEIVNKNK